MILIGSGFIAQHIKKINLKNKSTLIFASGVSNSNCKNKSQYNKELNLIKYNLKKFPEYRIVYFSSCSVIDKSRNQNMYQKHKLNVEKFIKNNTTNYKIFRLPELIGKSKNKNTLLNFLFLHILKNKIIHTSEYAYRNLIDIRKISLVVEYVLNNNFKKKIIDIANINNYSTINIIDCFEKISGKVIRYSISNQFNNDKNFKIDTRYIKKIYNNLNIRFEKNYLYNELKVIYSKSLNEKS